MNIGYIIKITKSKKKSLSRIIMHSRNNQPIVPAE